MAISILKKVNQTGIPCLETIGATLTTTGETYSFNRHPSFSSYFQGVFLVKVSGTATAPSTAVPIYFNTDGVDNSSVPVYEANGTAVTTATWPGDGVYLFFYDRDTNLVRLINVY